MPLLLVEHSVVELRFDDRVVEFVAVVNGSAYELTEVVLLETSAFEKLEGLQLAVV